MNKIVLFSILLSIIGCCRAGDDMTGLMKDLKAKVCTPSLTNAILDQMIECTKIVKSVLDAETLNKLNAFDAECAKDKDSELGAYKGVDITKNSYKISILETCSKPFLKCSEEKLKGFEFKKIPKEKFTESLKCMKAVAKS